MCRDLQLSCIVNLASWIHESHFLKGKRWLEMEFWTVCVILTKAKQTSKPWVSDPIESPLYHPKHRSLSINVTKVYCGIELCDDLLVPIMSKIH